MQQPRSGATPNTTIHTHQTQTQTKSTTLLHTPCNRCSVVCTVYTYNNVVPEHTRRPLGGLPPALLQLGTYRYHIMVPPWSVMPVVGEVDRMADCTRVEYTHTYMYDIRRIDPAHFDERHRRVKSSLLLEPRAWWVARGGRPRRVCASMSRRLDKGAGE